MPELPEVETVVREISFNKKIMFHNVTKIEILKKINIKGIEEGEFISSLMGKKMINVTRKGKWIFFHFDNLVLLCHLRMTGKFLFGESILKKYFDFNFITNYTSVIFDFSSGERLFFLDARGFAVFFVQNFNYADIPPHSLLGPDIFFENITPEYLFLILNSKKIKIKVALLDQKIISGIGNIYASEILFACKINPFRISNDITYDETIKIIDFSRSIINAAVSKGGTSIVDFISPSFKKGEYQNYLKVYGRKNKPCFECNDVIMVQKINNRSTFFCLKCQM